MRTKFTLVTLVLLLAASFNGFAQVKAEIVKTINQLLVKAIGGTDSIMRKGTITAFTITANSFSVEEKKHGVFKIAKTFASSDSAKEVNTITSLISDWKGFKVSPEQHSTTIKSIYPVFDKREGEPDNDKSGLKYYCLAGDEDKLITALTQLQGLYQRK